VILVSGENFPDALAANGFAGAMGNLPILITASKSLSSETAALIDGWGVDTVYIIGGTSAVSTAVETSLKSDHKVTNVKRIFGDDRYGTAKNVYINGTNWNADYCVVTTGESAADALSISPWAYSMKMPIFLTGKDKTLDSTSLSLIGAKYSGKTVFILGGTKAVDSSVETALKSAGIKTVTRLYGDDRYQTSAKIATEFGTTLQLSNASYNYTCFANGENAHTVDALVGGMLAGHVGASGKTKASPLVLVNGTTGAGFDLVNSTLIKSSSNVSKIYFLGGTAALTEDSAKAVLDNWASSTLGTWKITD
jgi:putative cell wall-binding protein